MKANEINTEQVFEGKMLRYPKAGQHYKDSVRLGHIFPTTDSQRKYVGESGYYLDVLGLGDVEEIEKVLNEHGITGNYVYTKNHNYVRLDIFSNARLLKIFRGEY